MGQKLIGVLCILFGIIFFIARYFGWMDFLIANAWVLIFWVFGFAFEIAYFMSEDKKAGYLIPGGVFLTIGSVFTFCALFGYQWMEVIWPFFIFAPAAGFIQVLLFSGNKNFIIPTLILSCVSGFFLIMNLGKIEILNTIFPFALVVIGVILLLTQGKKKL